MTLSSDLREDLDSLYNHPSSVAHRATPHATPMDQLRRQQHDDAARLANNIAARTASSTGAASERRLFDIYRYKLETWR
jgi:hypothetical protein